MSRRLPNPWLIAALVLLWLLLNESLSPGHLLLGTLVALIAAKGLAALRPLPLRIRLSRAIPRLAIAVFADIVRSNLAVARIILFPATRPRASGFVNLPIDMRSRYGLAMLAIIITATPGTLWMRHDPARRTVLIHVLDLIDEEALIALIKTRYERLLMDIFE
ncbi:Na+/H+ antiporter subunit E [Sphingomonas flavalba]|uniref:Na+/H+ antiporter subunit E n=1 Tax=Sphingomonas flavalba TaxID=2559804 RepID=UPI00109E1B4E|nr:Na+/H+ antiporter subunit E [Sphingomonas flavalba]